MAKGRSLEEVARELDRQQRAKRDLVVPTEQVELVEIPRADPDKHPLYKLRIGDMTPDESTRVELKPDVEIVSTPGMSATPTHRFHRQLGTYLGVPAGLYDRLSGDHPDLFMPLVNGLLQRQGQSRLIRTMDGNARALLSDRYRIIDHTDLLQDILPALREMELNIESCEVTETRLYLKATFPKVEADVKPGDTVQAGFLLTNSEIGAGRAKVEPFVNRLVCINGMVIREAAIGKAHLGRQLEGGWIDFSDDTKRKEDEAFTAQVKDAVFSLSTPERFNRLVETMRESTRDELNSKPTELIKDVTKDYGLTEDEGEGVLEQLIRGGDMSRWGLVNAVTAVGRETTDYDRATELEAIGGALLSAAS